jgi:MFS family permease
MSGQPNEFGRFREVEEHEEGGTGLAALLRAKWVRPALLVATGLAVCQQLVGINTIIYYAPTTLTNVGFAKTSAIYANLIIGVINVAMTVIAIRIIDRVGRRPMLVGGVAGMVGSLPSARDRYSLATRAWACSPACS